MLPISGRGPNLMQHVMGDFAGFPYYNDPCISEDFGRGLFAINNFSKSLCQKSTYSMTHVQYRELYDRMRFTFSWLRCTHQKHLKGLKTSDTFFDFLEMIPLNEKHRIFFFLGGARNQFHHNFWQTPSNLRPEPNPGDST